MTNKTRPYWYVDLKRIFGILSILFLTTTLILFTLATLLSGKVAIPLATYVVASQFSRDGLDDSKDIEAIKKELLSSGKESFYPIEGNPNVELSKSDIETLTPREIRLKIFRQIIEPAYYGGIKEITEGLALTPEQEKQVQNQAGILALINENSYQKLFKFFLFSIFPLVLSLSGLVFFSFGYGRLISPAVVFLMMSALPSFFLFLFQNTSPPTGDRGPIPFLPRDILVEILPAIALPFYVIFWVGAGLMAAVVVIKSSKKFISR